MKKFIPNSVQYCFYYFAILCMYSCTSEIPDPPKADFNLSIGNGGLTPSEVTFTNNSTNADSFAWDFGDGSSSVESNPKHTFLTSGEFTIKLIAKGDGGSSGKSSIVSIKAPAKPIADFSYAPSKGGVIPSIVVFTNKSSGAKIYAWDFGDGATSTEQHPQHTYIRAGQYIVKLTVKGDGGESVPISQTIIIIAANPIVAAFDISGGDCIAPCRVTFTNKSSNGLGYLWEFGDGGTSTEKDPVHEYKKSGLFTVKLTTTGTGGENPLSKTVTIIEPFVPEMIAVVGGEFMMGSLSGDADEQPLKKVTLSNYSIGKYPVTVKEYKIFCNETAYKLHSNINSDYTDNHAIVWVNFADVVKYCEWLSKKTGKTYRLPTEAEWEYAARGGNKSQSYTYSGSNNLDEVRWSSYNGFNNPPVGQRKANELGIYDMSGNVYESCSDWYLSNYYTYFPAVNPQGPSSGLNRIYRGATITSPAYACRIAKRGKGDPLSLTYNFGFRIVLAP